MAAAGRAAESARRLSAEGKAERPTMSTLLVSGKIRPVSVAARPRNRARGLNAISSLRMRVIAVSRCGWAS
jgi:hypothetical protein